MRAVKKQGRLGCCGWGVKENEEEQWHDMSSKFLSLPKARSMLGFFHLPAIEKLKTHLDTVQYWRVFFDIAPLLYSTICCFFMQMEFWEELSHRSLLASEVVADSLDESTNENISILSLFLLDRRGWIRWIGCICILWRMTPDIMPSCITSNVMGLG